MWRSCLPAILQLNHPIVVEHVIADFALRDDFHRIAPRLGFISADSHDRPAIGEGVFAKVEECNPSILQAEQRDRHDILLAVVGQDHHILGRPTLPTILGEAACQIRSGMIPRSAGEVRVNQQEPPIVQANEIPFRGPAATVRSAALDPGLRRRRSSFRILVAWYGARSPRPMQRAPKSKPIRIPCPPFEFS